MSTDKNPSIDDTEWQAQERGMRAALMSDSEDMDGAGASYRMVAKALMSSLHGEPPPDFAASVTACIAEREMGVERLLSRFLLAAFAGAAIVTVVMYGEPSWQALQRLPGNNALGWILAAFGCVVVSWIPRQLLELIDPRGTA